MNVRTLPLSAALLLAALTGCIQEASKGIPAPADDTSGDTDDTNPPADDTGEPAPSGTDLDDDGITDSGDSIVPNGDYVYIEQGLAASLVNTYLVGYGLGGSDGEYDWCSENLPIERYDDQADWPDSLQSEKVRFFFPDAVDIFFGNLRTFEAGQCDTSTDGGLDEWGDLTALNGHDKAVCPNPLDGNALGLYLMKDENGVFAPGCQGFALPPDTNRDSDNDGTPDVDEDDNSSGTDGTDGGTDSGSDSGGGSAMTVEVTTDSSWCSGTWELWAWNESSWTGNWPGLTSPDYVASGSADTLSGSVDDTESGDFIWVQGECDGGSSWLGENSGGTTTEHASSVKLDGETYVINYSTTDDTPAAGECNKRSTAYDMICQVK